MGAHPVHKRVASDRRLATETIRVFHSLYKVGRNGNFVMKEFNNSKKSYL